MNEDETFYHSPVLCNEAVEALLNDPDGVYIDGTLGGGGHTEVLLRALSAKGRVIAFDVDEQAITHAQSLVESFGDRVMVVRENFRNIHATLHSLQLQSVSGILLDLGLSSHHIDDSARGFSFQSHASLDMRMDQRLSRTAADVIAEFDEKELADLFWKFGEEKLSRKIARAIVKIRSRHEIKTTDGLFGVIKSVVGDRFAVKSAARVFQALRIEVNEELKALEETLSQIPEILVKDGRIVIIVYHSLEDRIVKNFFRAEASSAIKSNNKLIPDTPHQPRLKILTKTPIVPDENERKKNSRARSAKMRVAERI